MKKIIALGGSSSKKSINKTLASYVAHQLTDSEVTVIDLNDFELPVYSIDRESEFGMPENATKLNDIIKSADGFVISLAEHNGSFSAAFKNTTDWLSRIDVKVWNGKPMLLMASSPGKRGGKSVLETAKTIYPHAGANIIADFSLPSFHENFSQEGIADADLKESLEQKIQAMNEALQ